MAGYAGTPLAQKLGIEEGSRVILLGAPAGFAATFEPLGPWPGLRLVIRKALRAGARR